MRPVNGFERPAIQWLFVAVGIVLIAVAAAEAVALRRARVALGEARTAEANARLELERHRIEFARERRARETVTDEATRLRAEASAGSAVPTLTLSPLTSRGATPPSASVEEPAREQVIALRLLLPSGAPKRQGRFSVTVRRWSDGQTVWTREGLEQKPGEPERAVTALVAGDVFRAGSYEVLLVQASRGPEPPTATASYEVTIAAKGR